MEAFKFITANPLFRDLQEFVPKKIWTDEEKRSRLFNGPLSGEKVWEVQVRSRYTWLIIIR